MGRSPQTYGWEDFKPREDEDGNPTGRQLFSYDEAIRVDGKRRSSGKYTDWVILVMRQRNGIWTMMCLDPNCTIVGQGFGTTRRMASTQLEQTLGTRGIAAYRALKSEDGLG